MINVSKKIRMSLVVGTLVMGSSAFGAIGFTPPETLSSGGEVTGNGAAFKTKLVRLSNGMLVSAFGDSIDGSDAVAYGLKADDIHSVRDIFVRTCKPTDDNNHCSTQDAWSEVVNISNTAGDSSASTKWTRDVNGVLIDADVAFPGDSEKPNIFNAGTTVVVTWTDKYCPSLDGGDSKQRSVEYLEREGIEVPFSCAYEAHVNYANTPAVWTTKQITSGERDAKQDVNKGVMHEDKAKWIITWQEDPQGLQIGGGDGPGDGASGASVAHGTDIWLTTTDDIHTVDFAEPQRLTNNQDQIKDPEHGDANPIYENNGTAATGLESGVAGASRANTALVNVTGVETVPTALVTYEETKGTGGLDDGKYVIYHSFPFDTPETNATGNIISKEDENSRRVRFVTQVNPSSSAKMRMGIFWRQGNPTAGGPGDIMVRLGIANGTSGLTPADMTPAVNISSNTVPWSPIGGAIEASTNDLNDATDVNPYEDARAHRAAIRGDDFYIGYSYTKDWAIATYTDLDNYNFWMRRYDATTSTWIDAKNLSNITDTTLDVKEPRLVGMPGNGPGCLDTNNITNPENCQDKAKLLIAWGMASNGYEHIGAGEEYDIHYTRTKDKGETFEDITVVPGFVEGIHNRFESQLRPTPAGNYVFSVWNENDNDIGGTYSKLSVSTPTTPATYPPAGEPVAEEPPAEEPTDAVVVDEDTAAATTTTTSGGGGGCSYNPNSKNFDMMILLMIGLGSLYPFRRRFLK